MSRPIHAISWLFAVLLLVGCGGGGGTPLAPADAPAGPSADAVPEALPEAKTLEDAIVDLIDEPSTFSALQLETIIRDVFRTSASSEEAMARVDEALVGTVLDADALAKLEEASRALGGYTVHALPSAKLTSRNDKTLDEQNQSRETLILFVNGIGVDKCGFNASVDALEPVVDSVLPSAWTSGVYNVSAVEAEVAHFGVPICTLADGLPLFGDQARVICEATGLAFDLREAAQQEIFGEFGLIPLETVGNAREVASRIEDGVARGMRVIVVAHSQGNYFARDALRLLENTAPEILEGVGVIMLGSPEERSAIAPDLLPYSRVAVVQNRKDWVARLGNLYCGEGEGCVDSNVPEKWYHIAHHGFVGSYLRAESQSLARIQDLLEALDEELKQPFPTADLDVIVTDASGYTRTGATVKLLDVSDGSALGTTTTDSAGVASFTDLDAADYDVSITLSGYDAKTARISVTAGDLGTTVEKTIAISKTKPTTGGLTVTVYRPDKTTVHSGAQVQLIDSSGSKVGSRVTTSSSGKASWSSRTPGSYTFKVYNKNTSGSLSLEEFWGQGSTSITAGQTASVTFNRYMPYASNLLIGLSGTGTWLSGSSSVTSGSNIYFKIPIIQASGSNQTVKAWAVLDRNKASGYDYVGSTSETSIKPNSKGYHYIYTTAPSTSGTYYKFIEVYTKIGGNWVRTDSYAWTGAFKVK